MPQLKPFCGIQLNRTHPLARGLVGCWLMNEGGGNKVFDLSGNRNTGTLTNMAFPPTATSGWNPGKFGSALAFDGTNDYVDCGAVKPTGSITIAGWFKTTSGSEHAIISTITTANKGYALSVSPRLWLYIYGTTTCYKKSTDTTLNNGKWRFVAGVYDSSALTLTLYIDGIVAAGTLSGTVPSAIGVGQNATIGYGAAGFNYFNGTIDDLQIWNRALTASEIAWLYREMFPMFEPSRGRERIYALGPEVWLTGSAEAQSATSAVLKQLHRLVGSALAQSQVSAVCEIIRKVSSIAASVSDATGLLKTVRDVAASISGLAAVDGTISIVGETLLSGVVTGTAALSGTLILSIRQPWFGGSLEIERQWLREVLFNCVSANAIKLGTALTSGWFWVRVCGCSALYRGAGMEQMDFTNILAVAAKDACEIRPPSYLPHDSNSTYFYVIRRFNNCGYQERTLGAAVKVSIETSGELARPQPNNIFDSKAEQVNGNKIQLVWFYCPLEQKSKPVCFKIYWDSWTGEVDYENPTAIISYQGRKYYSYETGALEAGRYLFAIRAEDVHGVENNSLSQSRINLCTGSPDSINILSAETI